MIVPDTGERYLSKVHNDEWMRDNHLLDPSAQRVSDAVSTKGRGVQRLHAVQVDEPVRRALQLVEQHDITQIPVFRGKELVGTIYDSELLKRVLENSGVLDQPAATLMGDPLPVVDADEPLTNVTRLLATRTPAVLVRMDGAVTGILTRFDMLQFIAGNE